MRAVKAAFVLVLITACASPATSPTPASPTPSSPGSATPTPTASPLGVVGPIAEVRSSTARLPIDSANDDQLLDLVAQDTDFGVRLYRQTAASDEGNIFISPYSISTALSMAYPGARGNTAAEMKQVIGIWDDQAAWHAARNRLELELAAVASAPFMGEGERVPLTLEPVNTMFGQQNYPFKSDFLGVLAADYGAGIQAVDFEAATEDARLAINDWVAARTNDRIKDILAKGDVDELTRFVLVNAIYFKANWILEFDSKQTQTEPFHFVDGTTVDVAMMHTDHKFDYASGVGWQAVRVPYFGASMVILVPDEGRFEEIEATVDGRFMNDLFTSLDESEVILGLPRWKSETRVDLVKTLEAMGIVDLFDPYNANLTGVADVEQLYAKHVIHQANISVDEQGTEAAAATALVGEAASGVPLTVTLTVDRPFLYFIQDDTAHEILFMGRFVGP